MENRRNKRRMWFKFKSIRSRQSFWLLIVSLIPLIVFGVVIYNQRLASIKEEALIKLTAIRDLKVQRINSWLDERLGDIHHIANDYEIRLIEEVLNKEAENEENLKLRNMISAALQSFQNEYKDYDELFILHPVSGIVVASADVPQEGKGKFNDPYFTEPIRTGKTYIKNIYYSKTLNLPSMSFSSPIFSSDITDQIVGVLVARIDLEQSLYALLRERAGMGTTGETLIVNKDVVALSDLRWYKDASLKLKIEALPAVYASYGKTGIIETVDYRGVDVLAAYTYFPRTKWGFVAKQDQAEVYFPVKGLVRNIIILLLSLAISTSVLAFFIARNMSRPLQQLCDVTRKIKDGNLNVQAQITTSDEVGILAKAFNDMLGSLKISQDDIKQHRDHLEELVKKRTLELMEINKELSREITDRKNAEKTIKHLASFPKMSLNPIIEINVAGSVTFRNYAVTKVLNEMGANDDISILLPEDIDEIIEDLKNKKTVQLYRELQVGDLTFAENIHLLPVYNVVRIYARDITRQKEVESALKQIEWLLTKKPSNKQAYMPNASYGDLTRLNKSRLILDSVGNEILTDIVGDYLDLLDTSAAVYEKDGSYAFGIFNSSWCRELDQASRSRCSTADNAEALKSGKWYCHESCWGRASNISIEKGEPVECECMGGINLYAVPIKARGEIIGAINFGYGDPPKDPERLQEIAELYGKDLDGLMRDANAYETRPPFIIDLAKKRLLSSAKLIGEIVERKQVENTLQKMQDELEDKVAERTKEVQEKADRLAKSEDALVHLLEDVNKVRDNLEKANTKLRELDKLKSMFIASMSHELRTPLNSIIGFTGIILQGIDGEINPQQNDHLGRVNRSAKHLLELINDVIDLSKVEAGKVEVFVEDIVLDDLVNEAVDSVRIQAEGKILDLDVSVPQGLHMTTDKRRLYQCILNYLSNAVKFTESGTVSITAHETNGKVEIVVSDTGIGIPKEDQQRLFKPFVRIDSHLRSKILGTGLGLYLTRKLTTELLQGTVDVQSLQGKGSIFTLRVPKVISL